MKDWELGYLAGMIDAECHVGIQKEMGKKRRTPAYCIRFALAMTDRKPIDFINSLLPNSKIIRMNGKNRRQPYFLLRLCHQEALSLLRETLPYIQGKKRQVELCFELEELRKKLSPSRHHFGSRHLKRMPSEFAEKAEIIFKEFRSLQLNKKPRKKEEEIGVEKT